jgi:hypothetical protein
MAFLDTNWTATVTKVLVECWASGGSGRIGQSFPLGGGGGGGGAYARKAGIAVLIGNAYLVRIGLGIAGSGGESLFIDSATVRADPGITAPFGGGGGAGGQAALSTGDATFDGGAGGSTGPIFTPDAGAGGASSAGDSGPGAMGGGATSAVPGLGGVDGTRSGNGGAGGVPGNSPTGDGVAGVGPGGGGGGGGWAPSQSNGGFGGEGAVVIWDDTAGVGWPAVTANPPLAVFGSPPPNPPPPSATIPTSAFFM